MSSWFSRDPEATKAPGLAQEQGYSLQNLKGRCQQSREAMGSKPVSGSGEVGAGIDVPACHSVWCLSSALAVLVLRGCS